MAWSHQGHDFKLLDLLGDLEGTPFSGRVWRAVRKGRSVIDGSRGSGRWNTREQAVLYGALEADGAIAEMHHHMSLGQSVFPSRLQHSLYELDVVAQNTLTFADLTQLESLGVDPARYKEMLYSRTQEVGAAAAFLGFDGLITPSARWDCKNIVLFLDNYEIEGLTVIGERDINWKNWIAEHRLKNRG
ncbi:MAG: RES family NAD+ phosphorylase [Pseudomonadota bacterium]